MIQSRFRTPGARPRGARTFAGTAWLTVALAWSGAAAREWGPLSLRGYVYTMQSASFADDLDSLVSGNQLQGRLNFRLIPERAPFTLALEGRSRLFFGELPRLTPELGEALGHDPGWLDLSFTPLDEAGAVGNVQLDRLWAEWRAGTWQLRAGRQRINWGMALAWNPNDIFNAFDVLDFDYEERPGSDALRLQFFPPLPFTVELAAKLDHERESAGAARVGFNRWTYDFQILMGWYRRDLMTGIGWAGNLGNAGFKGEASWFESMPDTGSRSLSATVGLDYVTAGGIFLSGSALYNGAATGVSGGLAGLGLAGGGEPLSPRNLFPSRFAFMLQGTQPLTPILSAALAVIYAPDLDGIIAMPSLSRSIADNWDLQLLAQSLFTPGFRGEGLGVVANGFFLRLRLSF